MKSIILTIFFLLLFQYNSNSQIIKGDGQVKKENREISSFNTVIAQGNFNLILIKGDKNNITIETDGNLFEYFQTNVKDSTLNISMLANIKKYKKIDVIIPIDEIKKIILLDETSLKTKSTIKLKDLYLFSGGESKIDLNLFIDNFDLTLTDGTLANIKGYCKNLNLKTHDETELNAFDFQIDYCNILSTGLTDARIFVKKEINSLLITGGSNVYYIGNPKIKTKISSSTGFIVKRMKKD